MPIIIYVHDKRSISPTGLHLININNVMDIYEEKNGFSLGKQLTTTTILFINGRILKVTETLQELEQIIAASTNNHIYSLYSASQLGTFVNIETQFENEVGNEAEDQD